MLLDNGEVFTVENSWLYYEMEIDINDWGNHYYKMIEFIYECR